MSGTEEKEATDSEDKEFQQKEVEAQALRHWANNIVDKKQVMPAKDVYKLQMTQEQISFVKLKEYIHEKKQSQKQLHIEQVKNLEKQVKKLKKIAAEAQSVIQELVKSKELWLEKSYEVSIRIPLKEQQTVLNEYITSQEEYVFSGFYIKIQQLQTELMKYDSKYHSEQQVEKWTTSYYQLWQKNKKLSWVLKSKNSELSQQD